jgi:PPOX class probable F420-dependent enzyme
MSKVIPETHLDLLTDEKRAFLFLATLMEDGTPQVTPVWFDTADGMIRVNTARGRVKDHNMKARPKVAMAIMDPADSYRYVQLRGTVVAVTEEGAREHIDRLAKKYLGQERYPWSQPDEVRVMYTIRPDSGSSMG